MKNEYITNKKFLIDEYITQTRSNELLVTMFPDAINHWFGVTQDKLSSIKEIAAALSKSVILYDDIQDGKMFRRDYPSPNQVYGTPLALNCSVYLVLKGVQDALKLGNEAAKIYQQQFTEVLTGMSLDIYWRDNYVCPTEDEYKISSRKRGSHFILQAKLMQLFSENKTDCKEFLTTLALYSHIRDEYCNLINVEDSEDLMCYNHIGEGRFTWPMIHALKTCEGPTIRSILVQHTNDYKIREHCVFLMKNVGSLEYTRKTLLDLDKSLRAMVSRLGGNPAFINLLDELYNWNKE